MAYIFLNPKVEISFSGLLKTLHVLADRLLTSIGENKTRISLFSKANIKDRDVKDTYSMNRRYFCKSIIHQQGKKVCFSSTTSKISNISNTSIGYYRVSKFHFRIQEMGEKDSGTADYNLYFYIYIIIFFTFILFFYLWLFFLLFLVFYTY